MNDSEPQDSTQASGRVSAPAPRSRFRPRWLLLGLAYLVLLIASHVVRALSPDREAPERFVTLDDSEGSGKTTSEREIRLAYRDLPAVEGAESGEAGVPVLLLHGSPGRRQDYDGLAPGLARSRRVLVPDLPGFGESTRELSDYSIAAHARFCAELLEHLAIERVHVVGMSMGGGVAIELSALEPERVASLTLLSATGVQEFELMGDAHLNRALHGLQLGALWALHELVPHFGLLDDSLLSVAYARNFYDSDQRPLRGLLRSYPGPMLILHGRGDVLVPFGAALEHQRIVPQSELAVFDGNHFLLFSRPEELAPPLEDFLERVDLGAAATRELATPARRAAAEPAFDRRNMEELSGFALGLLLVLAGLATLVSEDLTCIAVGAMIGDGRISFWPGVTACFLGIYVGDLMLFLTGRWVGRRALDWRVVSAFLTPERVERSSVWFEQRGPMVIFLSRFLPGMRLPTYFASGVLRTSFVRFSLWFALAAAIWTPLLVWISSRIGGALSERVELLQEHLGLSLLATLAVGFVLVKGIRPLTNHRGRRLAYGRWRRLVRWEYWPRSVFYLPVAAACSLFALKHRRALAFTAVNPAIPQGGVAGESKAAILRGLARGRRHMARTLVLPHGVDGETRLAEAEAFRDRHALEGPLVVKPDVGERGQGVHITRTRQELRSALELLTGDVLVQEYLPGEEYGLFYARHPEDASGRLISIARKVLPRVRGDGVRTLERLILDDPRAVCSAASLFAELAPRLAGIPDLDEVVLLGELGTHCRGAAFLEGSDLLTAELERAVDELAKTFEGFHFGRFDVRSSSDEALRAGEFRLLELNGVTSESAHIYDPRYSVLYGWRAMIGQWRMAYAIGAANADRGARVSGPLELLAWLRSTAGRKKRGQGATPGEVFE